MSFMDKIMHYKDEITLAGAFVTIIALGPAALAFIQAQLNKVR